MIAQDQDERGLIAGASSSTGRVAPPGEPEQGSTVHPQGGLCLSSEKARSVTDANIEALIEQHVRRRAEEMIAVLYGPAFLEWSSTPVNYGGGLQTDPRFIDPQRQAAKSGNSAVERDWFPQSELRRRVRQLLQGA